MHLPLLPAVLLAFLLSHAAPLSHAKNTTCDEHRYEHLPSVAGGPRVVVVGELHGTREILRIAAAYLCHLVATGKPVLLGLEIPADEQVAINTYMESTGRREDRAMLASTRFWSKNRDGRASAGYFGLIETARGLRAEGKPIAVFAYGVHADALPIPLTGEEPMWTGIGEVIMARNIEIRVRQYANHAFLVVTGDIHARKTRGTHGNHEFEPMAYLLSQRFPVVAMAFSDDGGTAWTCQGSSPKTMSCGQHDITPWSNRQDSAYDVILPAGTLTASPPWNGE